MSQHTLRCFLCTRRDSNPYRWYRKPEFYPLNYGCNKAANVKDKYQ